MCCGAHGVVVSHLLRMRKALGSNPSVSMRAHRGRRGKARRLSGGSTCTTTGAPTPQWLPHSCVGEAHHAAARHNADRASFTGTCLRAHGVVVSHPLRMRKALGSNPSVSMLVHAGRCGKARRLSGGFTCTTARVPVPQWLPRSCVGAAQHAAVWHNAERASFTGTCLRAHGVVVSHPLRMRKALG